MSVFPLRSFSSLRRRPLVLAASCALVAVTASGCGLSHRTSLDIGLNRVGVNLAFANGNLNPPPIIEKIVIPAGVGPASMISELDYNGFGQLTPVVNHVHFPLVAAFVCHPAPKGTKPIDSSPANVSQPPQAGTYLTHQTGTFALSDGKLNFSGPVPPQGTLEVGKTGATQSSGVSGVGGSQVIHWEVVNAGLGTVTTTDYEATSSQLDLISETINAGGGNYSFKPATPVEIMAFSGQGATWTSAGADQNSGTVMTVTGKILQQAPVDVCGTVYDTYEVQSTEQITNVTSGISSQTNPSDPNIYWVATQYGGLFLSEHIDQKETLATSAVAAALTGGVAQVSVNYTSTVDSVKPIKK